MSGETLTPQNSQSDHQPVPLIDLVAQYETISDDILKRVHETFSTQQFVLGDEVAEFECDMAEYCDSRDAIGCASGTDALILALMALGIGPGDEVITSPFTFFATASAIHRVGATPVFADIDPVSFNIDPEAVENALTERTKAIMPVHLFGQCAEMEPLWRIAVRSGIPIIEDACQAIGAEYRGRKAGVLGTLGCFSFFPTKNLGGAGDGGLITTEDSDIAQRLRRLRVHGEIGQYQHAEVGLNSRLDALQATVLRAKLPHLSDWSSARRENAQRYETLFADQKLEDNVTLPETLPERTHVYNQYTVRVKSGQRDALMTYLRERKIGCGVYYPVPLHLQECFEPLGYTAGDFPQSELAAAECLSLPIFPELKPEQQELVVQTIAEGLEHIATEGGDSVENRAA